MSRGQPGRKNIFEGGRLDLFFTTYCAYAEKRERQNKHAQMPIVLFFTHQKARRGHPEDFPQFQKEPLEGPLDLFFTTYCAWAKKERKMEKHAHMPIVLYFTHQQAPRQSPIILGGAA